MSRHVIHAALVAGVALSLLSLSPHTATAQWSPSLVAKLGATVPIGDFSDGAKVGYNVGVGAEFHQPISPVGIRLEADFHENGADIGSAKFRTIAGIANLVFQAPASKVYLIGGAGIYRHYLADTDLKTTKAGINGGAGLRFDLTGFSTFLEARYHHVFTDNSALQMIPISFGVRF